jgi:hypothetical protein
MYDFYPAEWGPAKHDPDSPTSKALVAALALRDRSEEVPEDN